MPLKDVSRLVQGGVTPCRDKAHYSAPVLNSYGNIAELTRGGAISGIENSNGTSGGSCAAKGNPNSANKTCVP
jgi:hypothetical protein